MTSLATPKSSAALLAAAILACSCSDDSPAPAPSTTSDGGAGGAPPDSSCPAGELVLPDGTCQPVGIPEGSCGEGFLPDGNMGCEPILPPSLCPPGQMAVPGDETCRAVSACADGTWGDIPVEADTEFVDGSYAGGDSDGSQSRPWTTVVDAVEAAEAGAIVAIAEGSYQDKVLIASKPVRLWGRCPALVELVGTSSASLPAAVHISVAGSGSELRDLAIRGEVLGAAVFGAQEVLLERVWIHDTGERGLYVEDEAEPVHVTVRRSLIERASGAGLYASGSRLTVEQSVVRDTNDIGLGTGILAELNPGNGRRAEAEIRGSLLERNDEAGLGLACADGTVEASVVRDQTSSGGSAEGAIGVFSRVPSFGAARNHLTIASSVVEQSEGCGIVVWGGDGLVEATTVRGNGLHGTHAAGVLVQFDDAAGRGTLQLLESLVEGNHQAGVLAVASDLTVQATRINDTLPNAEGLFGRGMHLQSSPDQGPSMALCTSSVVTASHDHGVVVLDSEASFSSSVVRDTRPEADTALMGDGIAVVSQDAPAAARLEGSLIASNARCGLSAFGASLTVWQSRFDCNVIDLDGEELLGQSYLFEDLGDNACGCGADERPCVVSTTSLTPPRAP